MLDTTDLPLADLAAFARNPRKGDVDLIAQSLAANGQYRAIVVNRGTFTGRPMEVLAGNHTLAAARQLGWESIAAHVLDVDEAAAARIVLVDNKANDAASYDDQALLDLLREQDTLVGTGYTEAELESLQHLLDSTDYDEDRAGEYEEGDKMPPVRRTAGLDMIFSTSAACTPIALIGYALGWHPGIITSANRSAEQYRERFPRGKPILFMDNEWHGYDHAHHLKVLAEFHPKYATVRDIVTEAQAKEFGVEFYSVAETLRMAEEVAQHCERVILIPKYDCLEQLPRTIGGKQVVLGYSVESSYGGTDIPPSRFKGWPVHLLGGPWKKQRALLNLLGDDVVSLDNNNLLKISQFGAINMPDGTTKTIDEVLPFEAERLGGSGMTYATVCSLAYVMHAVINEFGVTDTGAEAADHQLEELVEEGATHEH